jgi:uncharacterized protein with PIN domain
MAKRRCPECEAILMVLDRRSFIGPPETAWLCTACRRGWSRVKGNSIRELSAEKTKKFLKLYSE